MTLTFVPGTSTSRYSVKSLRGQEQDMDVLQYYAPVMDDRSDQR